MITTRLYLDARQSKRGGKSPLKIVITLNGARAYIPTTVSLEAAQWDAQKQSAVGPQRQAINNQVLAQKLDVDGIIARLRSEGKLQGVRVTDVRDMVMAELHPESVATATPLSVLNEVIAAKSGRTAALYEATRKRLMEFCPTFGRLGFEDITPRWLEQWDAHMAVTAPSANARGINLRNLRAVFNRAITNEHTTAYPFRRFKIATAPTRKRNFKVDVLRSIINADVAPHLVKYRDFFSLSFMLCGINVADLCGLTELHDGRVEYTRHKTHKQYSIKVEPEAAAILERYAGGEHLLGYLDGYANYRHFYNNLCEGLGEIKAQLGIAELTSYWARHSWATIAASLDIPKETIAAALGHGGNSVTDIYIEFDRRKVDAANRRVLDWVLYGE